MAKSRKKTQIVKTKPDSDSVDRVRCWILEGKSEHDVIRLIGDEFPDADSSKLIHAAIAKFESASRYNPVILIGWCLEATRDVYRRMIADGDLTGALKAIKQLAELSSHVPDEEIEPTAQERVSQLRTSESGSSGEKQTGEPVGP